MSSFLNLMSLLTNLAIIIGVAVSLVQLYRFGKNTGQNWGVTNNKLSSLESKIIDMNSQNREEHRDLYKRANAVAEKLAHLEGRMSNRRLPHEYLRSPPRGRNS